MLFMTFIMFYLNTISLKNTLIPYNNDNFQVPVIIFMKSLWFVQVSDILYTAQILQSEFLQSGPL